MQKNKNGENLNLQISWSFKMLKQRLDLKLKCLAIVKADTKKINCVEYFKYNEINFYKLKSFDAFIDPIESGAINITFMIGIYKS